MTPLRYLIALISLLVASSALAQLPFPTGGRVDFEIRDFSYDEFRDFAKLGEQCAAPASSPFYCGRFDEALTLIPTKGVDFVFDETGEVVAAFAKIQKGQRLGSYSFDNRQNLIPLGATIPGGALLLDGEYARPEALDFEWQQVSETEMLGTFRSRLGELIVEKQIRVSNVRHTLEVTIETIADPAGRPGAEATSTGAGEMVSDVDPATDPAAATTLQYVFPGLGNADQPTIKIGQGGNFSLNPLSQAVTDPDYIALQTNNRNTGFAIVMRPDPLRSDAESLSELAAQSLPPNRIAMQKPLGDDARARLALEVYTGPNELVRYDQEGYAELEGLFRPNLLGRLSLGIIWVLRSIHDFIPSWGLSIIVLTLLFRALIWPLITTQTKSMYGMQQLQPKIQALQKKHKDDREKLTQETMKLYQEAGVNPAGGCLPILLQMPLFIILWRVFVNFEFNEGFLWLPDLGQPDPFYILPALYVGVMVGQSWFSARGNPQSLRQQLLINLVFVFIIVGFPAGVILYFVVSMLVQVFQYWLISRNQPAPAAKAAK